YAGPRQRRPVGRGRAGSSGTAVRVDGVHVVPIGGQRLGDVAADESGCSGNQDLHERQATTPM
ncbi:MAG: hypothetical protein QOK47_429, partial [Actinomycetota bacterium]|nr:hypothetical protein [Actinomycetota bacterium]